MPDGMQLDPSVIDEITREVRGLGDNWKSLSNSLNRDVAAARALAEEAKSASGTVEPLVKQQIDAFIASALEKMAAAEKTTDERMSKIETRLSRSGRGGNGASSDDEETFRAQARMFRGVTLAARGQLKVEGVRDEDTPYDDIKAYCGNFHQYLRRDERLLEMKAMQVGSDPDGGYWVPPEISARIITQVWETSPIRQIANVETISTDALEMPNDFGEFDCGWIGERAAPSETSTSQVGMQRIQVHEIYAAPRATQKLLEDSTVDVESWMARKVADKFARTENTAFVSGNGVNKPRGFLTYADGTTLPGTIEQFASGSASGIDASGIIRMAASSLKEPYQPAAQWLCRRATIAELMLLKDQQGRYLWSPASTTGLTATVPSTLLGYPVRHAADMPVIAGGTGALVMAFGDFRAAYTIVDRLGISVLRDPYTAKPWIILYSRKRVGGDVVNFEAIKLMRVGAS
jgi:HK97 family phage major capsid protein